MPARMIPSFGGERPKGLMKSPGGTAGIRGLGDGAGPGSGNRAGVGMGMGMGRGKGMGKGGWKRHR